MPTTLARSMTRKETGRPRSFSTRLQKMCPPSSGRIGRRLIRPRERLTKPSKRSEGIGADGDRLMATSLTPTMPEICLRCCGLKMWAKIDAVLWVTSHIELKARLAAVPAPTLAGSVP